MDFSMIVLLLAIALCTSIVVLAELIDFFDRMFRDAKTKEVKEKNPSWFKEELLLKKFNEAEIKELQK